MFTMLWYSFASVLLGFVDKMILRIFSSIVIVCVALE